MGKHFNFCAAELLAPWRERLGWPQSLVYRLESDEQCNFRGGAGNTYELGRK